MYGLMTLCAVMLVLDSFNTNWCSHAEKSALLFQKLFLLGIVVTYITFRSFPFWPFLFHFLSVTSFHSSFLPLTHLLLNLCPLYTFNSSMFHLDSYPIPIVCLYCQNVAMAGDSWIFPHILLMAKDNFGFSPIF